MLNKKKLMAAVALAAVTTGVTFSPALANEVKPEPVYSVAGIAISVDENKKDEKVEVTITNTSGRALNNLGLVSSRIDGLALTNEKDMKLETLGAGKSYTFTAKYDKEKVEGLLAGKVTGINNTPKTGDSSVALFAIILGGIALGTLVLARRKDFKGKSKTFMALVLTAGLAGSMLYAAPFANAEIIEGADALNEAIAKEGPLKKSVDINSEITVGGVTYKYSGKLLFDEDIVEVVDVTETEVIDHEKKLRLDENVDVTRDQILEVSGVDGLMTKDVKKTVVNGKVESSEVLSSEVTKEPVSEVKMQGTKEVVTEKTIEVTDNYTADNTKMVGEKEKISDGSAGKEITTKSWDDEKKEVKTEVKIDPEMVQNQHKAGSIEVRDTVLAFVTEFKANEEKEIGHSQTLTDGVDGVSKKKWFVAIDKTTGDKVPNGLAVESIEPADVTPPVTKVIEKGVLKVTRDVVIPFETEVTRDANMWDKADVIVNVAGTDGKKDIHQVMDLNSDGTIATTGKTPVDHVTLEPITRKETHGAKVPNWVNKVERSEAIAYETRYVAVTDGSLSKGEQRTKVEGVDGVRDTVYSVAVDPTDENVLAPETLYPKKFVSTDVTREPVTKVVEVGAVEIGTMPIEITTKYIPNNEKMTDYSAETFPGSAGVATGTKTYGVHPNTGELTLIDDSTVTTTPMQQRVVEKGTIEHKDSAVAFETVTQDSPNVLIGQERVIQEGADGTHRKIFKHTIDPVTGNSTGANLQSESTIVQPTTKIIGKGTKTYQQQVFAKWVVDGVTYTNNDSRIEAILTDDNDVDMGFRSRADIEAWMNEKVKAYDTDGDEMPLKLRTADSALQGWYRPDMFPGLYSYGISGQHVYNFGFTRILKINDAGRGTQNTGEEERFVALLNEYRVANNLNPVVMESNARAHAKIRSREIVHRFDHFNTGGYNENIALTTNKAENALSAWKNSAAHNNLLLNPSITTVGIGCYTVRGDGEPGSGSGHWVMLAQ